MSDNCWCTMTSRETTKVITKHAARYGTWFNGRVNRVPCSPDRRLVRIVWPRLEQAGSKLPISRASKPSFCELEMSTAANLTGPAELDEYAVLFEHLLPSLLAIRMHISLRLKFLAAHRSILPGSASESRLCHLPQSRVADGSGNVPAGRMLSGRANVYPAEE